ncbi:MAG: HigA family addiction module antitoxin [Mucilaginibacter sp.]|uniref:HigA family addiction module antitoxin n=1 Tax=Mucilaginibacter sp. TaxID=1882438 RepID=UPI0034E3E2B5
MLKQGMPPAHPGEVLKGLYLDPLEISITQAAANLCVSRNTLSLIINAKTSIHAEMALRLAEALNTTPELWLDMQQNYNLWHAKNNRAKVQVKLMRKKGQEINA